MSGFDERLVEKLVCPATRTSLRYDQPAQELISDEAGLAYPIRDDIPVMLIEGARRIDRREVDGGEQRFEQSSS